MRWSRHGEMAEKYVSRKKDRGMYLVRRREPRSTASVQAQVSPRSRRVEERAFEMLRHAELHATRRHRLIGGCAGRPPRPPLVTHVYKKRHVSPVRHAREEW